MAIQNEMPYGRTGWHGDQSVSLRSTLGDATALANDIRTQYLAVLAELDSSEGTSLVGDPTYDLAAVAVTIPDTLQHVALGGSYTHGDNAVALRLGMQQMVALLNEVRTDYTALLTFLDTNPGAVSDGDYAATQGLSAAAIDAVHPRFANGGEAAHGDQGVAMRLMLEGLQALGNDIRTRWNSTFIPKLDGDSAGNYAGFVLTADAIS